MPGLIAGYWANWGLDNRFSTYRVPAERGAATRIENRMPCATASPYLAAAATLNAALLGVVDGIDCGDPQIGDADAAPNTDRHTPHTLAEALDAVEADTVLDRGDGPRPRRAPTSPCAATRSPAGRRPASRLGPREDHAPGSSTATSRSTERFPARDLQDGGLTPQLSRLVTGVCLHPRHILGDGVTPIHGRRTPRSMARRRATRSIIVAT